MDLNKPASPSPPPAPYEGGEGCLTVAVRIPVRIVVLVLVVPVRMLWDLLALGGRAVHKVLLRPLGNALTWLFDHVVAPVAHALATVVQLLVMALLYWPWVALWRYVVVPVVTYGLVVPLVWVYRRVLTPLGQGLAWALGRVGTGVAWLARTLGAGVRWCAVGVGRVLGVLFVVPLVAVWRYVVVPVVTYGLVVPSVWVYRRVLTPFGQGLAWAARCLGAGVARLGRAVAAGAGWSVRAIAAVLALVVTALLVAPAGWLWRRVVVPVGREIGAALHIAWRVAGHVSRAAGRALKWLAWQVAGRPARWFYRAICTPAGHVVRDAVWRPARRAAAEAGRAARAALAGARATVRQARRDAWRALVGGPRAAEPVPGPALQARNLVGTQQPQTVPGVAAGTETSLPERA
ncbi:hypothetical protein [Streptomyces sp. t39]|uniref:hypothetical protein n=1 Tax=Streptomyces sp. t39 TaxID=1828156 RepID=UPI0011CD3B00|nr:hypothetical protein [Streptomyces sp. t39]TXS55144.1 hypothetical protein EAO77_02210 [Streptomyces sp. t39]